MLLCVHHFLVFVHTSPALTVYLEVGSDMRKAIADGFPAQNCIASDLRPGPCSHCSWTHAIFTPLLIRVLATRSPALQVHSCNLPRPLCPGRPLRPRLPRALSHRPHMPHRFPSRPRLAHLADSSNGTRLRPLRRRALPPLQCTKTTHPRSTARHAALARTRLVHLRLASRLGRGRTLRA